MPTKEVQPTSISNNGQRTETYDLAAECRSKVVGLHVDRRGKIISTPGYHLKQVSIFFFRKPVEFIGPDCFLFETLTGRVEPACPRAAPLGRRETTKLKLISTLTTSASKIQ